MKKRIGIIGFGTIGSYLLSKIKKEKNLCVDFVYDVDKDKLAGLENSLVLGSLGEARERKTDLIVETASVKWVMESAATILEFSDLLIASVVAFAQEGLQERLDTVSKKNNTRYYISHGGILGLDGIKDGKEIIEQIKISTIRPQRGFHLPDVKEKITKRSVLFEGIARHACKLFPRDVNIFATLALHGLGFDETETVVVVEPEAHVMRHIIEVKGQGLAWTIEVQTESREDKKSGKLKGYYVPESFFQTVKRICKQGYGMNLI